jgi:hypothetical protein
MNKRKVPISQKYRDVDLLTEEEKNSICRQSPWKHFVLDNFIEEKPFKRMQKTLLSKKHRFTIADEDPYEVKFALLRYLPLAKVFYSKDFKYLLEKLSNTSLALKTENMVQLRYMNQDSPALPIHIDTAVGQVVIAIYYLSPNWTEDLGGHLYLHTSKINEDESKRVDIKPVENRLFVFMSDNTTWHSVKKVGDWERYCVLSTWNIKNYK